ncbi:hypothetical protein HanIR_Chr14g0706031 [Helianthus annuus]|nr:hypothetical protein HanIR_Chr14g0706031 [Helianthus annuus]
MANMNIYRNLLIYSNTPHILVSMMILLLQFTFIIQNFIIGFHHSRSSIS